MSRIAVVAFNLGGPDSLEAVQPFLFNLFNDAAIIGAPGPIRWLLAKLISRRRAPVAQAIYAELGGGSPLLPETQRQAAALSAVLADLGEVEVFPCMRYWHPRSDAVAEQVRAFAPDRIVLLPLYPQYSTTTSASSIADWRKAAAAAGIGAPDHGVCCYPCADGMVAAQAALIADKLRVAAAAGRPVRLLFSAHGLPKRVIEHGDPYQWQVEQTSAAVASRLAADSHAELDWVVCYQSRVGPLEWIGPSTDDEIVRAGSDGVGVVLTPIAFVSEHSETLVELDIEYRKLADDNGVPAYERVPALGVHEDFITALANEVRGALARSAGSVAPAGGVRLCPGQWRGCPCSKGAAA